MQSRRWVFGLLFLLSFYVSWAQKPVLIACYPLKENGKEISGRTESLQLINIAFKENSSYTNGLYGDYETGKGNLLATPSLADLNYNEFLASIWFKASEFKRMPVLVMGRGCRLLAFYLSEDGNVMLKGNNMEIVVKSDIKYQINQWYQATITYKENIATIFLGTKKAAEAEVVFSEDCTTQWQNTDFSTTNFANGECFKGYLKELQVYSTPEETDDSTVVETNTKTDNNNSNTVENVVDNTDKTSNSDKSNIVTNFPIKTPLGELRKLVLPTNGTPPDAIKMQNSQQRLFFLMKNKSGTIEAIWQDVINKSINLTKFNSTFTALQTIILPSEANSKLLAATNDNDGNYYYMVFQTYENKTTNDVITLYKADINGRIVKSQLQSSAEDDLNIYRVEEYSGALCYQNGCLLYMMGRIMNKSSDGLNHQGGIGVAFDPQTLLVMKNFGQTSGHSFDNFLTKNQDGNFIAIDLGDNYPRGIHLHKFSKDNVYSKVIYTFKTEHGTESGGYDGSKAYPLYQEISTPTQKYYKWSNDNATYTELGGVVEVNDGYCVIFAGEPDPNGRSLNSSRIGNNNKDSRNLGFIKVRKDFEQVNASEWNVVPKDLVLSSGLSEKGGFYTFGGSWTNQGNEGVMWLTNYKNVESDNVKFIKTASLPNGNILIFFGKDKKDSWSVSEGYKSYMMCIRPDGSISTPAFELGDELRLNRRDEIMVSGNQIIIAQGNETEKKLQLFILDLK